MTDHPESLFVDPSASMSYLAIVTYRRDLVAAREKLDRAVWAAHRSGMTNLLIAHAMGVTPPAVRFRLKRIRRDLRAQADQWGDPDDAPVRERT